MDSRNSSAMGGVNCSTIPPRFITRSIDSLDDDSLFKIFSYIPLKQRLELRKVCTRWHRLSQEEWIDVKILDFLVTVAEKPYIEHMLDRCGKYLTHLSLTSDQEYFSSISTFQIDPKNKNRMFQERYIIDKISNMSNLRCLKLKNIIRRNPTDTDIVLNYLPASIEELHLDAVGSDSISPYTRVNFEMSLQKFRGLRQLTLSGYSLGKNVIGVISEKKNLTHLSLSNCRIDEENLSSIINLTELEHLGLEGLQSVDDELVISLAHVCKKLKYLNLSFCKRVTNISLSVLAKLLNLEELMVNRLEITDAPLGQFKKLRKLECSYCFKVSDSGVIKLFKNSPNLEKLDLSMTSITYSTVIFAYDETKYRKNNFILHLIIDRRVMEVFGDWKNKSPFLLIETRNNEYPSTWRRDSSSLLVISRRGRHDIY